MEIIFFGIGALISGIVLYFLFQSRLRNIAIKNVEIEKENEYLEKHYQQLTEERQQLYAEVCNYQTTVAQLEGAITYLQQQSQKLSAEILKKQQELNNIDMKSSLCEKELLQKANELAGLQARQEEIEKALETAKSMAEQMSKELFDSSQALMQEKLESSAQSLAEEYQKYQEEYVNAYSQLQADMVQQFLSMQTARREELAVLEKELLDMRSKRNAAIQALQREEERRLEQDKYRIIINEEDISEVIRIREIASSFRNPRVLYKALWEGYFRNPTNSLITRTVGTGRKTGIYKITSMLNGMVYIGQSNDIAERFKEHIKTGLGLETSTNLLYTAMKSQGVENFTFEVLEECEREKLNAQEAYWIEFYQSQIFGFNMTKGNKTK